MRHTLRYFAIATIIALPIQAHATLVNFTPSNEENSTPEKLIEDGLKMIIEALQLFSEKIPNYKEPEILENGDIIIRRIHKTKKSPKSEKNTDW